jgi:hypothetical protein
LLFFELFASWTFLDNLDIFFSFLSNLIVYSCLGFCYFNFITLGETARRIRLLRELTESPKGLTLGEIDQRYNAKIIIQNRINRLLNNKQVILKNDRYFIGNPTVLMISKIFILLKIIFLAKKSEFGDKFY